MAIDDRTFDRAFAKIRGLDDDRQYARRLIEAYEAERAKAPQPRPMRRRLEDDSCDDAGCPCKAGTAGSVQQAHCIERSNRILDLLATPTPGVVEAMLNKWKDLDKYDMDAARQAWQAGVEAIRDGK